MNLRTLLFSTILLPAMASAQERYSTRTGEISFFSATSMENIEAVNHKATSVFDPATSAMEFAVLIKAFEFKKALMQEHFNENYMESNTFPKSTFKGKLSGASAEDLKKPGKHDITVEGELTIHGVTKHITAPGTITTDASATLNASSNIIVMPEDYGIRIPSVVRGQIAEEIQVKIRIQYQKM